MIWTLFLQRIFTRRKQFRKKNQTVCPFWKTLIILTLDASEIVELNAEESTENANWNSRFQSLLQQMINTKGQNEITLVKRKALLGDLAQLAKDFLYTSTTYGKIIISEVSILFYD